MDGASPDRKSEGGTTFVRPLRELRAGSPLLPFFRDHCHPDDVPELSRSVDRARPSQDSAVSAAPPEPFGVLVARSVVRRALGPSLSLTSGLSLSSDPPLTREVTLVGVSPHVPTPPRTNTSSHLRRPQLSTSTTPERDTSGNAPEPSGHASMAQNALVDAVAALADLVSELVARTPDTLRTSGTSTNTHPSPLKPPTPVRVGPRGLPPSAAAVALSFGAEPQMLAALHGSESLRSAALMASVQGTSHAVVSDDANDGSSMVNQYLVMQVIGTGSQGKVVLAADTTRNEFRAIKVLSRPTERCNPRDKLGAKRRSAQMAREIAVMKKCRHANLITLYEVIDDPQAQSLFLVMRYAEHGSLARMTPAGRTTAIPPRYLAVFARQLCAGLMYLHNRGVIHMDIKPENILVCSDETVCLGDFGLSAMTEGVQATTTAPAASLVAEDSSPLDVETGTVAFQAPELMLGLETVVGAYDPKSADIWSLGMTFYALLCGHLPFPIRNAFQYSEDVTNPAVDIELPTDIPKPARTYVPGGATEFFGFRGSGSGSGGQEENTESAPLENTEAWHALLGGMLDRNPQTRWDIARVRAQTKALCKAYDEAENPSRVSEGDLDLAFTHRVPDVAASPALPPAPSPRPPRASFHRSASSTMANHSGAHSFVAALQEHAKFHVPPPEGSVGASFTWAGCRQSNSLTSFQSDTNARRQARPPGQRILSMANLPSQASLPSSSFGTT